MKRLAWALLWAVCSTTACPQWATAATPAAAVEADRMLARVLRGKDPAALRWLLAPARIARLSAEDRADLVSALLQHRDLGGLALAVRAGIDPNQALAVVREGETLSVMPLTVALGLPEPLPLVRELLRLGADPQAVAFDDQWPLVSAAAMGQHEVLAALLAAGARAQVAEPLLGMTPLMALLSRPGEPAALQDSVRRLLDAGADVNAVARTRQTALLIAVAGGHVAVVPLLLQAGADVQARDEAGRSALDLARAGGHPELLRLLEAAAAASCCSRP